MEFLGLKERCTSLDTRHIDDLQKFQVSTLAEDALGRDSEILGEPFMILKLWAVMIARHTFLHDCRSSFKSPSGKTVARLCQELTLSRNITTIEPDYMHLRTLTADHLSL